MSRDNTPSAPSTLPGPATTRLDSLMNSDSPEPTWPPTWGKICRALFPNAPLANRVVYPSARPYTGSLDSPSTSDTSSSCSVSPDACQALPSLMSQMNVTNITVRVFYRPGELPAENSFTPSTIAQESPKSVTKYGTDNTFATAAENISEASGLSLNGLRSAKSFKDVIRCLLRAIQDECAKFSGGESDDEFDRQSAALAARKKKSTAATSDPFKLNSRAFMSYDMISKPGKELTLHDSLESLVWIFLYIVLRYSKHNAIRDAVRPMREQMSCTPVKNKPNLNALLTLLFCQNTLAEEEYGIGFAKLALFLTSRPLPPNFEVFDNPAITSAVFSLIELFEEKYRYLERTLPKKVRALAQVEEISYEEAEIEYMATTSYKRHMEVIDMLPERMENILLDCMRDEDWPEQDILVDGLAGQ
ncbi:hypothetical protein JR316_0004271 [Psilocybe cubensis]|uniref:Uncharacterized protein n=2 Tax=Psilocybe cubensis TaxID=181762 RepID=A0ACB8H2V9_PSICU|nr:hypothetical protein JR316_0004271 [Psilocybe cubensis]KAH9482176.1 hypothetical protein JR316_0004271 [Psilocybe cubensis]